MAGRRGSRREFWREHLRQWRERGGTLKAYAEANGLSVGALYAAKRAHAGSAPREVKAPGPATLLPVHVLPGRRTAAIRVCLPNGVLIEVPVGLGAEDWAPLLPMLGQRP